MRGLASVSNPVSIKLDERIDDSDIRRCAQVVFEHFGATADLYTLMKVREKEAEGDMAAVAVWVRIAGVISTFEGMGASTAIH